ncbi:MAG: SDR family NAD(P)-dependent oxidoreductase, partial [Candidatus Heimdallarchaeota archaeon]
LFYKVINLKNKTNFMGVEDPGIALITGASAGIGEEYAKQLASQGFDLILTARRKDRLEILAEILAEKHGVNIEVVQGDLFKSLDVDKLSTRIKTINNLDCLVNNAGFGTDVNFLNANSDINLFINMLNLHCKVPMQLTHAALPGMINRDRGHIANISSVASLLLHAYQDPIYDATKAFLSVFSEVIQLRLNVMKSNVKVKAICPGWTVTEIHDKLRNFDRTQYVWMNVDEVVRIALDSYKSDEIIVITGDVNVQRVLKSRKEARDTPGRYFYF